MNLWIPGEDQHSFLTDKLEDVIKAYSLFIEVCHPDHLKHFDTRLRVNPDAARSEAVVFSWLRGQGFQPKIDESPGIGGMDYRCLQETEEEFLIEVTSLNKEAVEQRSGLPDELDEVARSFSMITPNLWSKARHKARQLEGYQVPKILCICLIHSGASILLGTLAAERLMTSEPKIEVLIGSGGNQIPPRNITDLEKSAFFELSDGVALPVRRSISAILLISIWNDQLSVVGMLHPAPSVPLDYRIFREVPFLRLEWPIKENTMRMEWVVGHPSPRCFYHRKINMTDAEYRGE